MIPILALVVMAGASPAEWTVVVPPGLLKSPEAIASSPHGGFWVADRGAARLHLFSAHWEPLSSFGGVGQGGGAFADRVAVADPGGQFVYAADTDGGRVVKLTREGVAVREMIWKGDPASWVWRPRGLAALPDGRVFVADEVSGRILVTDPFDGLRALGGMTERPTRHLSASGIACEGTTLVVADPLSRSLWVMDVHGNLLERITLEGSPGSLDLRDDGLVAYVDEESQSVWVVTTKGEGHTMILADPSVEPSAVCFTSDGALLVADRRGDRVIRIAVPRPP